MYKINHGKSFGIKCKCGKFYDSKNKFNYHVCPECNKVYYIPIKKYIQYDCYVLCPKCKTDTSANYNIEGYCLNCKLIYNWNKDHFPVWEQHEKIIKNINGYVLVYNYNFAILK